MINNKIAFIGGGNMGEGLIKGLLDVSLFDAGSIIVSDPRVDRLDVLKKQFKIRTFCNNRDAVKEAGIILLAVKPSVIRKVLDDIADLCDKEKLIVSIAAGVSISAIQQCLPDMVKVIRVMPNTPAMVGEGVSAICAAADTARKELDTVREIFSSVGKTIIVEEKMMDAVTGLSGSGPAFIFLIIEAMVDAGVKMALPRDIALLLAAQTVKGAAEMVLESGKHVGMLKDMVTSPGGTTIAGLHALENGGIRSSLFNAVEAATLRSEELRREIDNIIMEE